MKFIKINTKDKWKTLIRIEDIDWISKEAIWMKAGDSDTSLQRADITEEEFDRIAEIFERVGLSK